VPLDIVPSVCPHDCPSACALDVERIDARRIGRVRVAAAQAYTRGMVCAKVARYAERQQHPVRLLSQRLRRVGESGAGCDALGVIGGLWPNHAFEEGIGVNLLTSADPGLPRGGAVFHDTSVWLSPA
jgi:Molybdopterin oxidoreductase Fe4S4 domain